MRKPGLLALVCTLALGCAGAPPAAAPGAASRTAAKATPKAGKAAGASAPGAIAPTADGPLRVPTRIVPDLPPSVVQLTTDEGGKLIGNNGNTLIGFDGATALGASGAKGYDLAQLGMGFEALCAPGGPAAPLDPRTGPATRLRRELGMLLAAGGLIEDLLVKLAGDLEPGVVAVRTRKKADGDGEETYACLLETRDAEGALFVSPGTTFDPASLVLAVTFDRAGKGRAVYRPAPFGPARVAVACRFDPAGGDLEAESAATADLFGLASVRETTRVALETREDAPAGGATMAFRSATKRDSTIACLVTDRAFAAQFDAEGRVALRHGRREAGGALTFGSASGVFLTEATAETAFYVGADGEALVPAPASLEALTPAGASLPGPADFGEAPLDHPTFAMPTPGT
jgi:hypothetical protein